MTRNLSWVTPPGSLANFAIGRESTVDVIAVDTANTGATISYSIISGELPPGLSLNSATGEISGTPVYSTSTNNYFISLDYNFVVRALTSDSRAIDGGFKIIISNTVNQDFNWVTPAGTLGTVPNGQFYSLRIEAQSQANLGITYSFVSGELPPGMQLISNQVDKLVDVSQNNPNNTLILNNTQTVSINDFVYGNSIPVQTRVTNVDVRTDTVTLSANTANIILAGETLKFFSPGYLQGVPTILDPVAVNESRSYRFTIRATNSVGHVNDRAFSLSVTNINGPIIEPQTVFLGSYFDGSFYNKQLELIQLNPAVVVDWSITTGELPPGLSLDQNGVISGYLEPVDLTGSFGPAGFDGEETVGDVVTEQQGYDIGPYQFNQLSQSIAYTFTVQAYDGANYDLQTYVLNVVSTPAWTVDSTIPIDDSYLTIDYGNVYVPVLRNRTTTLPAGRQASYYAFKFDGYDFEFQSNAGLTYSLVNTDGTFDGNVYDPLWFDVYGGDFTPRFSSNAGSFDNVTTTASNLPGVLLDAGTGWLYGLLSNVNSALETFTFGVQVSKTTGNVVYSSAPRYFTLPVIGDPNSTVSWTTEANLGIIDNGTISNLVLEAVSATGKELFYTLVDESGTSCRLPQGLQLLPTGEISGRATFEAFTLDNYATTFDNESMTIDRTSTFTVKAETVDGTSSAERTFSVTLRVIDTEPYENLYLRAMPTISQRDRLNSLFNDSSIFDPALIYRPTDPNYGIQSELKMLLLSGLTPSQLTEYQQALTRNHFNKTYQLGDVKTAYVLDNTFNVTYEVVYVEISDPGENENNQGPALSTDLSNQIDNPYIGQNGDEYFVIYPNSTENMQTRLETAIGYQDQSSLPPWMTSNQPDPNTITGFTIPLGYTKACVLAYAKAGSGEKIAYRIKKTGFDFSTINFTVDRYQIDNFYSTHYDIDEGTYIQDRETTFDSDSNIDVGAVVATVNYAVEIPFNEINGRSIDYINNVYKGIDGEANFREGETLVFVRQENFNNLPPYDGWVDYSNSYIGDNTETTEIEGFDSTSYDTYTIIPGFLEKSQQSVASSTITVTEIQVTTSSTLQQTYTLTVNDTTGIVPGGDLVFSGSAFGNLVTGLTYQVTGVIDNNHITINKPITTLSFTEETLFGNGTTTVPGLSTSTSTDATLVSVNGVILQKYTDYTISGTSIVFSVAPALSALIIVRIYTITGGKDPFNATGSLTGKVYSNLRGGVWQIQIVNNVVNLNCLQQISVNDKIKVLFGKSFSGAVLTYSLDLNQGSTVPFYKTFIANPVVRQRTTFNNDTTKFFTYRDRYYEPGSQDKYIKFPQYGVFE